MNRSALIKNWIEFPEPVLIPIYPVPQPALELKPLTVPLILPL